MDPAPPLTLNVIKEDGLIKQGSVGAKSFVIKFHFQTFVAISTNFMKYSQSIKLDKTEETITGVTV